MVNAPSPSNIGKDWTFHLQNAFQSAGFIELCLFLERERATSTIYPGKKDVFAAFSHTPLFNVKVVILGQDPYHGDGQANGLAFSVPDGIRTPPSLRNIFKELQRDLNIGMPPSTDLRGWADQGVLLLNTVLTVRQHEAGSHHGKGWEQFTDAVISVVSGQLSGVIFLLWGKPAQRKEALINTQKHVVLKAPHPSPLSAHRGFIGCGHFSSTNTLLQEQGKMAIDWGR